MSKVKSARHHWWPRCVSRHWAGEDGKTGWLRPDGTCIRTAPDKLGVIGNAHHIKPAGAASPWDSSFESEFDKADSNFPRLIDWLNGLQREYRPGRLLQERFIPCAADDERLRLLTESVVSLAVRAPMNREASVSLAEKFRGPIASQERNALIGLNMRQSQRLIADSIGCRAKFVVLFAQGKEFIYGDGFFHNVRAVVNPPMAPKMLAPITPSVSVLIARPISFSVEPRLSTIVLSDEEVDRCNRAVQVYSRRALYFRAQKPKVEEVFACEKHLEYSEPDNPIDALIYSVPGVPPRDASLDALIRTRRRPS